MSELMNEAESTLTRDVVAPRSETTTFVSHRAVRWFSVSLGAVALALAAAPVAAQDKNPLDEYETPEPEPGHADDGTVEVVQPSPRRAPKPRRPPSTQPSRPHHAHPHAHPYAPSYGPPHAPTHTPQIVGYEEKSTPRVGLIVGGSVLFAISYLVPLSIVAAADFPNETDWLAVPLVGPWMTMARMRFGSCRERIGDPTDTCDDRAEEAGDILGAVALGFTGVLQAGGLTMLVVGAAAQKTSVVPIYAVTPMVRKDALGCSVSGAF